MLANDGADVYSIDISSAYLMKRGNITEVTFTSSNTLPCIMGHKLYQTWSECPKSNAQNGS